MTNTSHRCVYGHNVDMSDIAKNTNTYLGKCDIVSESLSFYEIILYIEYWYSILTGFMLSPREKQNYLGTYLSFIFTDNQTLSVDDDNDVHQSSGRELRAAAAMVHPRQPPLIVLVQNMLGTTLRVGVM